MHRGGRRGRTNDCQRAWRFWEMLLTRFVLVDVVYIDNLIKVDAHWPPLFLRTVLKGLPQLVGSHIPQRFGKKVLQVYVIHSTIVPLSPLVLVVAVVMMVCMVMVVMPPDFIIMAVFSVVIVTSEVWRTITI